MKLRRLAIGGIIMGVLLAGCVPSQQQMLMERDLSEMKRRLAGVEQTAASLRQDRQGGVTRERMDTLALAQAELQATLDNIRVELQAAVGQLEDMRRERAQAGEELALLRDDMSLKIAALEDRLAALERKTEAEAAAPGSDFEVPEVSYERAVEMIRRGDFAPARQQLQAFLNENPQHPLAINAMYWIGESYYGEKKLENAILQFQDVIQKYPDHPKTAAALLKQAVAFEALGDRKNARVILQRLIDTFPMADEAKKAKARLASWGNS